MLLLEDAPSLAALFTRALKQSGFEVRWCRDVQEAVTAAGADPGALWVLDDQAPDGGANAFLRAAAEQGWGLPPAVLLLSTQPDDVASRFEGMPIAESMAKPLSPAGLVRRCRALLAEGHGSFDTEPMAFTEDEATGRTLMSLDAVLRVALTQQLEEVLPEEDQESVVAGIVERLRRVPSLDRFWALGRARLSGDLSVVNLLSLMQVMEKVGASGVLYLDGPGAELQLELDAGAVTMATPGGIEPATLYARWLAEAAVCALEEAEERVRGLDGSEPITELLTRCQCSEDDLRRGLRRLTLYSVRHALAWQQGAFLLRDGSIDCSAPRVQWNISALLLEASVPPRASVRRWALHAVPVRRDLADEIDLGLLGDDEGLVMAAVDGRRNLAEIAADVGLPRDVLEANLEHLFSLGLLTMRTRPVVSEEN